MPVLAGGGAARVLAQGAGGGQLEREGEAESCPACHRALSNATRRWWRLPCGHVLCRPCADKFLKVPEKDPTRKRRRSRCAAMSARRTLTERAVGKKSKKAKKGKDEAKRGLIEIQSDGTGFAGGGRTRSKRDGTSFQC